MIQSWVKLLTNGWTDGRMAERTNERTHEPPQVKLRTYPMKPVGQKMNIVPFLLCIKNMQFYRVFN